VLTKRHLTTTLMRALGFALLCLPAGLIAADHDFSISADDDHRAGQNIALASDELADATELRVDWTWVAGESGAAAWLDVGLVAADGRFYSLATPVPLHPGSGRASIVLGPESWGGRDGPLGADALLAIRSAVVRIQGGDGGSLSGQVSAQGSAADTAPDFTVSLLDGAVVDRGPWRELRLRLAGEGAGGERGELDLVDATHRWPLFLDQPAASDQGRWRATGPACWVLRLAPGENPSGHLEWHAGARAWTSRDLPKLSIIPGTPLPPTPREALAVPVSPVWHGRPCLWQHGTAGSSPGHPLQAATELPECPAPILSWQSGWTGFRGGAAVAWPEAAACDNVFAAGAPAIDLLPQLLFNEHGAFRFGLAPWQAAQGGPWQVTEDAFAQDGPWQDWRHHARAVIARARATPGLTRWRLGLIQPANGVAEEKRLRGLIDDLGAMVDTLDGRPLDILHPQAVDYAYQEKSANGTWFSFEDGASPWRFGPVPISGAPSISSDLASDGVASLAVPLTVPILNAQGGVDGGRCAGVEIPCDANLFNLESMALDVALAGDGAATVYAFATDDQHHWFQQRLADVPGNKRWHTLTVPWGDDAPWQGPKNADGTSVAWGPQSRWRVRTLGFMAFFHPNAGAGDATPTLYLDRVRRLGWPRATVPPLAFEDLTVSPPATAATVAAWQPLCADFHLNFAARNPYDTDYADVSAEVQGPDGKTITYPAYWAEPVRLDFHNGRETAVPVGTGAWHWRFTPPGPGTWKWRMNARIRFEDAWKSVTGDWQTAQVAAQVANADDVPADPTPPGTAAVIAVPPDPMDPPAHPLVPIRVSQTDDWWWEKVDGRFFYPLGINLRSPGDDRQQNILDQERTDWKASTDSRDDIDRPIFTSNEFDQLGTRAYARWLPQLHAAGANWVRVWMCPWWCGLEWKRSWDGYGGVTWFNQMAAARLDRVLDLALANRMYVQIELQNHGFAGESADAQWYDSPYNRRNGGPCATSVEYFSREDVFAIHAKRLRYTLARWGWRSHLAAWVLSSELEWTGAWGAEAGRDEDNGESPSTELWVRRSLDWFTANDPQQRPVSIHFSHPWTGMKLWAMPGLGFSNSNAYTGFQDMGRLGGQYGVHDLPGALRFYLDQEFPPWKFKRPTLIGEWGGHWSDNTSARLHGEFHNGLWVQAVTPYGGDTGFWWWLWVDATKTWNEFAPVAAFVANDDRRGMGWHEQKPTPIEDRGACLAGMASADLHLYYAWVKGSDQDPAIRSDEDQGAARIETGQPGSGWKVERWNCQTGTKADAGQISADSHGRLALPLGVLAPDAAFKLRRLGGRVDP
jgi:hypothetical protein